MSAAISATVTESVSMAGAPFSSASTAISGETAPIIETSIDAGATDTMTGIAFPYNKCGLLYLLSDQTDCTVTFTNSGTAITIHLTAGVPYLLYTITRVEALLLRDVLTMTVQNMNTTGAVWSGSWTGGVANVVATDFHARFVLSAP